MSYFDEAVLATYGDIEAAIEDYNAQERALALLRRDIYKKASVHPLQIREAMSA